MAIVHLFTLAYLLPWLQLQLLLSDYLDIRNTSVSSHTQGPTNFDEPSTDIGLYFAKKRTTKPKKVITVCTDTDMVI